MWGSKVLVTDESPPRPTYLRPQDLSDEYRQVDSAILLGEGKEHTYFAIGWPSDQEPPSSAFSAAGTFRRLRSVATLLDGEAAALLAYAKGMVHYHERHRFCPTCGAPTVPEEGGHLRVCTDLHCGSQDFVRTDPAIIVLVRTQDRCLLARQPTWPGNLYSIIAGFVEPGESLEAAVAREVEEEAGIQVKDVRYQSSQPWPFPRSLMIGFTATATTTAIRLNDGELEDARWLSREDIARELIQGELQLPSPISISHRLIESWFDAEGSVPLRRIVGGR
ncbi:MAG: NAD(+) diphosphatase [Anaerolineae bacterium]